jgi:dynein heavy chain
MQFNFVLQNFARKTKFPIDTISWDFEVVPGITDDAPKSEDGTYIRGLYIEGARFDSDAILMAESRPKELFTSMPPIWLKPAANRKKPTQGIYECPCYKTLTRAGMIIRFFVMTSACDFLSRYSFHYRTFHKLRFDDRSSK